MKSIGWERGTSPGKLRLIGNMNVRREWMCTFDKSKFSTLEDYHKEALFYYGYKYEVKTYEWKNHYSVRARRVKDEHSIR